MSINGSFSPIGMAHFPTGSWSVSFLHLFWRRTFEDKFLQAGCRFLHPVDSVKAIKKAHDSELNG